MDMPLYEIRVAFGEVSKIAEIARCSRPYCRKVLRGRVRDERAMKIRKLALQRGGVEIR